ncbi:hypothetical protein KY290_014240 [Solanum tuberosum]|uniref:Secreted protein n=1 Tax=Solanum tuberosum TaxID=4113 RepID=A0ABQ7VP29_SOLTU|nr:hypothetical protein KY289_014302 [Solanum tuberosum]KAH0699424.1 hypothetical protein KY284_013639 [Solanum tuberosum]KAH0770259.1 hypothetical protein KY290_014240 [Solanum tuberosum]
MASLLERRTVWLMASLLERRRPSLLLLSFCTEPEFGTHEPEFGSFSRYGDPIHHLRFHLSVLRGMDLLRSSQYRKDQMPR